MYHYLNTFVCLFTSSRLPFPKKTRHINMLFMRRWKLLSFKNGFIRTHTHTSGPRSPVSHIKPTLRLTLHFLSDRLSKKLPHHNSNKNLSDTLFIYPESFVILYLNTVCSFTLGKSFPHFSPLYAHFTRKVIKQETILYYSEFILY